MNEINRMTFTVHDTQPGNILLVYFGEYIFCVFDAAHFYSIGHLHFI